MSTFVNNIISVYSGSLDASKAFDFVHCGKLFKILLFNNVLESVIHINFMII